MRSTHYQSDKPQWRHFTPMGDPAGYLDEGKGLPWITMDSRDGNGNLRVKSPHDILPLATRDMLDRLVTYDL